MRAATDYRQVLEAFFSRGRSPAAVLPQWQAAHQDLTGGVSTGTGSLEAWMGRLKTSWQGDASLAFHHHVGAVAAYGTAVSGVIVPAGGGGGPSWATTVQDIETAYTNAHNSYSAHVAAYGQWAAWVSRQVSQTVAAGALTPRVAAFNPDHAATFTVVPSQDPSNPTASVVVSLMSPPSTTGVSPSPLATASFAENQAPDIAAVQQAFPLAFNGEFRDALTQLKADYTAIAAKLPQSVPDAGLHEGNGVTAPLVTAAAPVIPSGGSAKPGPAPVTQPGPPPTPPTTNPPPPVTGPKTTTAGLPAGSTLTGPAGPHPANPSPYTLPSAVSRPAGGLPGRGAIPFPGQAGPTIATSTAGFDPAPAGSGPLPGGGPASGGPGSFGTAAAGPDAGSGDHTFGAGAYFDSRGGALSAEESAARSGRRRPTVTAPQQGGLEEEDQDRRRKALLPEEEDIWGVGQVTRVPPVL
jgi:hypothetical protein